MPVLKVYNNGAWDFVNIGNIDTSMSGGNADTVDNKHAKDFVAADVVVTTATPNMLLKLDANGKLPADITGAASKLSTSRNIKLQGNVEGDGSFNGEDDTKIDVLIKNITEPLILSENVLYGDNFPEGEATKGRLFFKKVNI